ncbi:MAG: glycosyltransferase family 4 protein [Anaerolineales bacterium]|nr:glycosyltransferase family 4 protein [Anaerolineales bacterium]
MISKACVVGAYQGKLEQIALHQDIDLTVIVPPLWRDKRGTLPLERVHTRGYKLLVEPILFNGSYHFYYYPNLGQSLISLRPDVVHIDEEPYNFATWHALRIAQRLGAYALFFAWQNIDRRYPWPFCTMESYVLKRADAAIFGSSGAYGVWKSKGYRGYGAIIPQFGIDPDLFPMRSGNGCNDKGFSVGFVGRLVREKGVDVLLRALAKLPDKVNLVVIGAGPERNALQQLAVRLQISERIVFVPWLPSMEIPERLRSFDALVLPSRTTSNWKEQFGRVLLEAMASGVPVIGSDSGEIPSVIGDAGLMFPEGDFDALARQLLRLMDDNSLWKRVSQTGRDRVMSNFSQAQVASETVSVYRRMANDA